ncbi:MAG: type II secretion system protein [Thermodesulfobacteriota bacterium]|nr:MAG: type II secretion system protein [Thermodesulfobacteriota bacterium]
MKDKNGFTLIEVMASIAIMGAALGVLLALVAGGLRLAKEANGRTGLVLAASERFGSMFEGLMEEGVSEGVTGDGFAWRMEAYPYGAAVDGAPRLLKVVVTTTDLASGAEFRLISLKGLSGG